MPESRCASRTPRTYRSRSLMIVAPRAPWHVDTRQAQLLDELAAEAHVESGTPPERHRRGRATARSRLVAHRSRAMATCACSPVLWRQRRLLDRHLRGIGERARRAAPGDAELLQEQGQGHG